MYADQSIRALTPADLLRAWETGVGHQPLDRGLALLWCAGAAEDPADLPLTERDRLLLALRRVTFGGRMHAVTACPDCAAELEVELNAERLAEALPDPANEILEVDGRRLTLRALTCRDVAAATQVPEADAPAVLRQRVTGLSDLSDALATEVDARLEAREAEGELRFTLTCTECDADWTEFLDVGDYLWREVDMAARRLMSEVAEIAAAFGWTEQEILALSPARRRAYLELARGG